MLLMCMLVHQRTTSLRTGVACCEMYGGTIHVADRVVFRVWQSTCDPEKRPQNVDLKELFVASCLGRARCVRCAQCARCALYSRHAIPKDDAAESCPEPHRQAYRRTKVGYMPLPVTFWISFGECNNTLWLCISYLTIIVNTSSGWQVGRLVVRTMGSRTSQAARGHPGICAAYQPASNPSLLLRMAAQTAQASVSARYTESPLAS